MLRIERLLAVGHMRHIAKSKRETAASPDALAAIVLELVPIHLALLLIVVVVASGCGESSSGGPPAASTGMAVVRSNLVSDVPGQAAVTDPALVNAWGIAASPTGPFWISDNGQGVSTLYDGNGQPFPAGHPLVVTIPVPQGSDADATAAPTGMVYNGTADFMVTQGTVAAPSLFIFSTEDGTLSGWSSTVNPSAAILAVDNSAAGALYKGLALASTGSDNRLYATDFHNGHVDVFDANFTPVSAAGAFNDPQIPAGFAPFGIATIEGNLYVTYAKQDSDQHDDVKGAGNGFVDIFAPNGTLVRRFASQGTLNSPWGVVQAPAGFGSLAGAILVGNFGDGRISAFNKSTGALLGQLDDGANPLVIDGLWGLSFGNGGSAGNRNTLFFTAGPDDEQHGLFGMLQPVSGM